ncbi:MAG TPA: CHAD domain-containing protein [Gemmatimonadales bacterium]|jgi:CHAD domain-containing protein
MELITRAILDEPSGPAAGIIAGGYLEQAMKRTAPLIVAPGDAERAGDQAMSEDVHDFRVALRRLRGWFRVCHDPLADTVPGKNQRALRRISRRAGKVRDLEIEQQWLLALDDPGADAATIVGASDFTRRAGQRHQRKLKRLRQAVADDWPPLAERLGEELNHDTRDRSRAARGRFGTHLAAALRDGLQELRRAARPRPAITNVAGLHALRIEAKRLRYLLESFDPHFRRGARTLALLVRAQDAIGALHDEQMIAARIGEELAKDPDDRGLVMLRRVARRRIREAAPAALSAALAIGQVQVSRDVTALAARCESRRRQGAGSVGGSTAVR